MKSVLIYYPSNFWESNPEFLIHPTFVEFSKLKNSSNIMWAFSFLIEKKDNMYKELPEEERRKIVASEIIGNKKFNWKEYDNIYNLYKKLRTTVIDTQIETLETKLKEREDLLKDTKYSIENALLLDKLIVATEGLLDKLSMLKARLDNDSEDIGVIQGDMKESFLESD
jgi:hypothetical protein